MVRKSNAMMASALVGLVCLVIISPAWSQSGKTATSIPLNVVIDDSTTNAVRSDGQVYSDSLQNVRAETLSGNYFFDTNENKGDQGRRVNLYFPSDCTQCPASGPEDVYIATIYSNYPVDNLASLQLGQYWDKRFALNWSQGGSDYVLRWNYPIDTTHGNVRFTCSGASAGVCVQWIVTPTGTTGLYLKQYGKGGKLLGEVLVATVNMPFVMTLNRQ